MTGDLVARMADYMRGLRRVAPQVIVHAWATHKRHADDRRGEAHQIDALIDCAKFGDYGQGETVNAEIGAEIARRLEASVRFNLDDRLERATRDNEIIGLFVSARASGTPRQATYDEIAAIYGITPDTVRKVIAATPIETFEAHFPELDRHQVEGLICGKD